MSEYQTKDSGRREAYVTGAVRNVREGKGRFDLLPMAPLRRWAQLMERGAKIYGDRNWERGMPVSRCLDSAMRHLCQLIEGLDDEDHAAAVLFNVGAVIHFREGIAAGVYSETLDDAGCETHRMGFQTPEVNV